MNATRFFVVIGIGIAITGCESHQRPSVPDPTASGATSADVRRRETIALEGNWTLVSVTMSGKTVEAPPGGSITFVEGKMIMKDPAGPARTYQYRIDPVAEPKSIEMTDGQNTNAPPTFAIYELDGNRLRLCLGGEGKRPKAFDADGGRVFLLRRE